MHYPAFTGCTVQDYPFEQRVAWYALWIASYPFTTIHFKYPHLGNNAGFLSEPSRPSLPDMMWTWVEETTCLDVERHP